MVVFPGKEPSAQRSPLGSQLDVHFQLEMHRPYLARQSESCPTSGLLSTQLYALPLEYRSSLVPFGERVQGSGLKGAEVGLSELSSKGTSRLAFAYTSSYAAMMAAREPPTAAYVGGTKYRHSRFGLDLFGVRLNI